MIYYVVRRVLQFIPTGVALALSIFFMIYLIPGDPASAMLGIEATEQAVAELREKMGLNEPLLVQLKRWAAGALRGDLGRSYFLNQPVAEAIATRFPVTLGLSLLALATSLLVGIPAGVAAAVRRGSWLDASVMVVAQFGLSIPNFWLGLNLMLLFAVRLRWFPTGGYVPFFDNPLLWLKFMTLPSLAIGLSQAAIIARMTRASMLEVLSLDYVRTARAKGLPERTVVYRHALKNAMIPVITVIGIGIGVLLGGAVVTETVFTLPGLGRLVIDAVRKRDYPVVQGGILVVAMTYMVVNLIVDLMYAVINPRIRYS